MKEKVEVEVEAEVEAEEEAQPAPQAQPAPASKAAKRRRWGLSVFDTSLSRCGGRSGVCSYRWPRRPGSA